VPRSAPARIISIGIEIDAGRLGLVYVSHPVNALLLLLTTLSLADIKGIFTRLVG
jgi:hypothetical protein